MGRGKENMFWNMFKCNCYQLKAAHSIYSKLCMNLMVTTKQTFITNTQKKESEYNTKESHQTAREEKEERNRGTMKTARK